MEQGERIMIPLAIFATTFFGGFYILYLLDVMKDKAYWEGRRAGYARGIADTRNHITQ